MKTSKQITFAIALALMAGGAGVLLRFKSRQSLGPPGVKAAPISGAARLEIILPERVGNFSSKRIEPERVELDALPADTSLGRRIYEAPDGFAVLLSVVLMGTDRTSIHQPDFCLKGQGWAKQREEIVTLPVSGPKPCELPVRKLTISKPALINGQPAMQRGIYLYWFVADGEVTASAGERMWAMSRELLRTGVLQRWAYVTCFAVCWPGQEDATFQRMKEFLAASVPQFQQTGSAAAKVIVSNP